MFGLGQRGSARVVQRAGYVNAPPYSELAGRTASHHSTFS